MFSQYTRMKLVLVLMIRNESRILERCLKAVENLVDAYCITDTGSTDNTCEIARKWLDTHPGRLWEDTWSDFGTNRTLSFKHAKEFVEATMDPTTTYGLLLDADMEFVPGRLMEQNLQATGYTIIQIGGNLEYPNTRLIRMDQPGICKSVTHEYWQVDPETLGKDVCFILDRNDGGCKSDKFERDCVLLEKGLREEPDNVRYMFYLAQTYHCMGRHEDSIAMYKRRIEAGGWFEEVWYSHYMVAQEYMAMDNIVEFEAWMQRAIAFHPQRAEAAYKLTRKFRELGQHYKAYHYLEIGSSKPRPSDSLFIEKDIYEGLFDYERSILDYYVKSDRNEGMRSSVRYMLKMGDYVQNVLSNMQFYAVPIGTVRPLTLPRPFGQEFTPSAISVDVFPLANVRYKNYWMENGQYLTPDGGPVRTRNAYISLTTGEVLAKMDDSTVGLPGKAGCQVLGLEDLRLNGNIFTANTQEYTQNGEGPQMIRGIYNWKKQSYDNCEMLKSPDGRHCEKNWLAIPGTNNFIYDWHPLRVIGDKSFVHPTPPIFSLFRGSAPPLFRDGEWWALVHLVEYSNPRKYYHCMVIMDRTFKPIRISLPFVFKSPSIEYCVSMRFTHEGVECYISIQDKDSAVCAIRFDEFRWESV